MRPVSPLEGYLSSVGYESRRRRSPDLAAEIRRPVITISRQAGAGAHVVAEMLVARLQARTPEGSPPWTMFDRDLVDEVLHDHELPDRLARYMPEDRIGVVADTLDELFGLHPSTRMLVRKTAETILHLAELGNVVVIGRGANIITSKLDFAFHVRLVGTEARRVAHIEEYLHLAPEAAATYVREHDAGRMRYVKEYYGRAIDDPLLYHLVIDTDRVPYSQAARLIAEAVVVRGGDNGGVAAEPSPVGVGS